MPEAQPGNPDIGNYGERMVAGSGGWGYYAHLSLYARAAGVVKGKRVLEGGFAAPATSLSHPTSRVASLPVIVPLRPSRIAAGTIQALWPQRAAGRPSADLYRRRNALWRDTEKLRNIWP